MLSAEHYSEKARELFLSGYNCAQSVVGAFAPELNADTKTLLMTVSPFGGGMGRMREVCGAVSGMFIVAGMLYGYSEPEEFEKKALLYSRIQHLAELYKKQNGSIICRELLGLGSGPDSPTPEKRTDMYYRKRPCADLCACAAGILAEYIAEHPTG